MHEGFCTDFHRAAAVANTARLNPTTLNIAFSFVEHQYLENSPCCQKNSARPRLRMP